MAQPRHFAVHSIRDRILEYTAPCGSVESFEHQLSILQTLTEPSPLSTTTTPSYKCPLSFASRMVWCRLQKEPPQKTADRLLQSMIEQQQSSHPVTSLVVDANDVISLVVAEHLHIPTFGIINQQEDFLLDEKHYNAQQSGIIVGILTRLWLGAMENAQWSRILMKVNRLRVAQSLSRLRTLSHIYDRNVVLIQTSSNNTPNITVRKPLRHYYNINILPPCIPCFPSKEYHDTATTTIIPTVIVECTFPYSAAFLTRTEEKLLLVSIASVRQTQSLRLILGSRSWFKELTLPDDTLVETSHSIDSSIRNNAAVLIRRCLQPLHSPFSYVNIPSASAPIVICFDDTDDDDSSHHHHPSAKKNAIAFTHRLIRALQAKADLTARQPHDIYDSQRDGLRWTVNSIQAIEMMHRSDDGGAWKSRQTPNWINSFPGFGTSESRLSQPIVNVGSPGIAMAVITLVLSAYWYFKWYPRHGRRHLQQHHRTLTISSIMEEFIFQLPEVDETGVAICAWISNAERSVSVFVKRFRLPESSVTNNNNLEPLFPEAKGKHNSNNKSHKKRGHQVTTNSLKKRS